MNPSYHGGNDQLVQVVRSLKDPAFQGQSINTLTDGKCGFSISAAVHFLWGSLSINQKEEIKKIQLTGASQKSRIIGKFRIIYDTTGINEPALLERLSGDTLRRIPYSAEAYVDSVGRIFNDVYQYEVEELGYTKPPLELGESYYRVVISNISDYGTTWPQDELPPLNAVDTTPRYTSFIEIHNDFRKFYTKGMDALKVTAAHEFHHVIQIGSYGCRFTNTGDIADSYAYELTSTWMEDVVYTDVNDYYNYLSDYFNNRYQSGYNTGLSFNSTDFGGYERCVWAHFLAKKFGRDVIRDVWTFMRIQPFLESSNTALVGAGSNLQSAFAEFTRWNYFTADRANPDLFYPEGAYYPRFQPLQQTGYNNSTTTMSGSVFPLSSSMYAFGLARDTITAIVANVDVVSAIAHQQTMHQVDVTLSSQSLSPPYQELQSGLKAKVFVADTSLWRYYFSQDVAHFDASPNPFRLADGQQLLLPVNADKSKDAEVYFYGSSLNLASSGQFSIFYNPNGTRVIRIPASALKEKLSSGIYFIIAKTAANNYQWKVAIIR